MRDEEIRRAVAETARQMSLRGLTHGASGNVSARIGDGVFAVTPTGMPHATQAAADVVLVDGAGNTVDGTRRPTSELPMHLSVYRHRPDVGAVVHTHSDMATTFAVLGENLPAVHYVLGFAGPRVLCAPYATYGTQELGANALEALGDRYAALLGNHGVLAVGPSLGAALTVAESVEVVAGLYWRARCIGSPRVLDDEEMERVMRAFASYGQPWTP